MHWLPVPLPRRGRKEPEFLADVLPMRLGLRSATRPTYVCGEAVQVYAERPCREAAPASALDTTHVLLQGPVAMAAAVLREWACCDLSADLACGLRCCVVWFQRTGSK